MTHRRQICLHIGYGKTGTTTLQRSFFDRLNEMDAIHYFGMFLTASANDPNRSFFKALTASLYVNETEFAKRIPDLKDNLHACVAGSDEAK